MRIIDNLIAIRILWLLITPFEKTDAYRLGLIDGSGTRIKKAVTSEESNATSMLHRLVWNVKKFINLVPGGATRIGSIVAAYALVRECVEKDNYLPTTEQLTESYELLPSSDVPYLIEDAPVNATAGAAVTEPVVGKKAVKRYKVSNDTFAKFKSGKSRRISNLLNLESDVDQKLYQYTKENPSGIFIIENEFSEAKVVIYTKQISSANNKFMRVIESHVAEYKLEVEGIS